MQKDMGLIAKSIAVVPRIEEQKFYAFVDAGHRIYREALAAGHSEHLSWILAIVFQMAWSIPNMLSIHSHNIITGEHLEVEVDKVIRRPYLQLFLYGLRAVLFITAFIKGNRYIAGYVTMAPTLLFVLNTIANLIRLAYTIRRYDKVREIAEPLELRDPKARPFNMKKPK
jgi:hypothetical protein